VRGGTHDDAGISGACAFIELFVHKEAERRIAPEKVLLGRDALASHRLQAVDTHLQSASHKAEHSRCTPARVQTPVSGVFAMSSYLPMVPRVREQLEAAGSGSAEKADHVLPREWNKRPQGEVPVGAMEQGGPTRWWMRCASDLVLVRVLFTGRHYVERYADGLTDAKDTI
jgi:hypothetical protein